MRRYLAILILVAFSFSLFACGVGHDDIRRFERDFTIEHEDLLNIMFDNEWTIKSIEERFDDGEDACACGCEGIRAAYYLEWVIEYYDGNGEPQQFLLNNRYNMSHQIENHMLTMKGFLPKNKETSKKKHTNR